MADNATVVGEDVGNTGGDKYETTAREIQICRFSTFCSKWRMTFRKVTPAALKVNVKKFWQVLLVPWHVWAPIWVHFAPWWSIFPVKNRFSHIFPVPGGLPFLTVILTVKLARLEGGSYLINGPLRFVSQLPAARPALCSLLVLCNYLDDWTAHQGQPIST